MRRSNIMKMTLSAMFLALAFVMPFLTGQIPQIGSMLCPMHIPVLLCALYLCVFVSSPGYYLENVIKARVEELGRVFEWFNSKTNN